MRKTQRFLSAKKNYGETPTVKKGISFQELSENKEKTKSFHEEKRKVSNFATNKVKNQGKFLRKREKSPLKSKNLRKTKKKLKNEKNMEKSKNSI